MTVVNPKSISGITSITTASGSDNLLTIHTSDASNTERFRIDSTGTTKIVTGIVTTLTATTGIATHFTADKISLPDSTDGSLCIGIGSDLKFNHNGTDSFITEVGGGDLYIQGSDIILRDAGNLEKHIEMTQNGAVDIYHNGTKKLETTSTGVTITGGGTFTGDVAVSGANITLQDSGSASDDRIALGAGGDLQLFHDATNSVISNQTGDLYIENDSSSTSEKVLIRAKAGESSINCNPNGSVELYYDNNKKAETLTNGFSVTGSCYANNSGAGSGTSQIELQPYGTDAYLNVTASNNFYTRLGTGYTIRTQIDSSGNFHVNTGNIVISTAGKGIDFSATSDAAPSSEILDDYEEGTWTAVPVGFTNLGSISEATYVKIGQVVHVGLNIFQNNNNMEVTSGDYINGLPYPVAHLSGVFIGGYNDKDISGAYAVTDGTGNRIILQGAASGMRHLWASFTYRTTS